jgi:hypothetical protein
MKELMTRRLTRGRQRARWHVLPMLVFAASAAACSSTFRTPANVPAPMLELRGRNFVVYCHFACAGSAPAALRAAESTWQFASMLLGDGAAPERPLEIHLYGSYLDYEIVERKLTRGQFRNNRALTHPATLSAHVVRHPYVAEAVLREFGLTSNTNRVIAHEALHLAALAMHEKTRWLPMWLQEGIATWTEAQVLVALNLAPSIAEEPVSSTRAHQLQQQLERGSLLPLRELLADAPASMPLSERYAFYQYFFDFLWTRHRPVIGALLRAVDDIRGSGGDYTERATRRLFSSPAVIDSLDREFREYISSLPVSWVETRRTFSVRQDAWVQVGFEDGGEIWRVHPPHPPPAELTGRVQVLGAAEASALIALQDRGFIAVTFRANGRTTVTRYPARAGEPATMLAEIASGASEQTSFRIRMERDGLVVWAGSAPPFRLLARSALPTGQWGLSVSARGNAVWRDVRSTRAGMP